ncbi:MAG: hypothetical protein ABSF03_11300 [Streptosporangiaceae bacterium]
MSQPLREDSGPDARPDIRPDIGRAPTKADEVAAAVAAAPGVAALSGGRLGGVGTYLPGRRVTGVIVRDGDLEVHVIGRYGVPVGTIAAEVRRAAEPFASGQPVHVIIEDLA